MLAQHNTDMASRSGTGTAGDSPLDTLRLDPPAQTPAATRLSAAPLGSETFGATLSHTIGDAAHTYAKAEAAQMARAHPSLATEQVAVHLAHAVKEGLDRISIHLKPAVLGRIDVELNLHHDGRVLAVVMAERPETLDLLQRDARELARALQDAGLKADAHSLHFGLRGGDGQRDGQSAGRAQQTLELADRSDDGTLSPPLVALALAAARGGIDIRV